MKRKFWIGFGDYANFSKKDRTMFYVVPADGNSERKIDRTAFVEAESAKQARDLMVAEIDKWLDHELHMDAMNRRIEEAKAKRTEESMRDQSTTSLSIVDPELPAPDFGLLNLTDLDSSGKPPVC